MIRILVDSSSDYTREEAAKLGLDFLALSITLDGKNYRDNVTLDRNQFFELMQETSDFPKTSQPSPDEFLEYFQEVKEAGDSMICILLSSALSGTYQSALLAKKITDYEEIYIVDSLTATYCIRLLADQALALRDQGLLAAEIVHALEELRPRVKVIAVLDTLEYLQRGGRIPKAAAAAGNLLNLKPVITVTTDGKVDVMAKCIGKNKAISYVMNYLDQIRIDPGHAVYAIYSYGTTNLEVFENHLKEKQILTTCRKQIGATIGAHIGPGAFGLVYAALPVL